MKEMREIGIKIKTEKKEVRNEEGGRKEFISLSYIKGNRCDFLYKRAFH